MRMRVPILLLACHPLGGHVSELGLTGPAASVMTLVPAGIDSLSSPRLTLIAAKPRVVPFPARGFHPVPRRARLQSPEPFVLSCSRRPPELEPFAGCDPGVRAPRGA